MALRIRERRSSLADWSMRFALVSVPVLVIAAIGHRSGMMAAVTTFAVMALAFGLAAFAVIAAIGAFEAIWRDGRKGLGAAIRGLLIGLLVLAVPILAAWHIIAYPRLTDVSTDPENPPALTAAASAPADDLRPITDPSVEEIDMQREAYPDIVPRHYPVGPGRVFEDARRIVTDRGWTVLASQQPEEPDGPGSIEAYALSTVFGFRQDVAIRILADGEGTLVDMRSVARNGGHDLGANADRIRAFFRDLDSSLQGISEEQ